jgi:hypothetical protein
LVFRVRGACDLLVRDFHEKALDLMHPASSHLEMIAPQEAGHFNVMYRPDPDAGALSTDDVQRYLALFTAFFGGVLVATIFLPRRSYAR